MKCPRCGTEEFYQGPNHRDGDGKCVNPECYLWDGESKKPVPRCATEVEPNLSPPPPLSKRSPYISLQFATPERIEKGYIDCPQCGSHHWQYTVGYVYQCRTCGNVCHQALLELFAKTQHEVFKEKFQRSGGSGQCDAGGMEPDLSSCRTGTEVERQLREYAESERRWREGGL